MFVFFSVDLLKCVLGFLTTFRLFCCRCLLGFLSMFCPMFCPCSIRILVVLSRVFTGTSTRPLCAFGFFHPQVVPLLVSSHLLNVPFIVSWLNIISCNRACTVIHNTVIISKLDLEKCLSVLCRFSIDVSTGFCRFFVILLSMLA